MAEWTFQRKLFTGIGVICLLVILTTVASLMSARMLVANMTRVVTVEGREFADARALQILGARNIADAQACLLSSEKRFAVQARMGSAAVRDEVARLDTLTTDAKGRALLDAVLVAQRAHEVAVESALPVAGAARASGANSNTEVVLARGAEFDQALAAYVTYAKAIRLGGVARSEAFMKRIQMSLGVMTVVTIVLLGGLCIILITVLNQSFQRQATARGQAERGQTQAKTMLSEAEAIGHLKDEFLATVSHELRNPLAPILTWTQLLRSGSLNPEKTARALEVIERNVMSQPSSSTTWSMSRGSFPGSSAWT